MKKTLQKINKEILIIFATLLLWVIFMGILDYNIIIFNYNPIYLIVGIALYIPILLFLYIKIIPKIEKNKYLPYIIWGIFTILCVTISLILKVNPSWDMGTVHNIAIDYASSGHTESNYLYQFPNNIMLMLIYYIIFKFFIILKVTDYVTISTIFNALIISLTVLLLYVNVKKMFDNKKALMVLIISLFTTPLYLYGAIYYTDTLSMFMVMLMIYVFLKLKEFNGKLACRLILSAFLGMIIFMAIKIKITTSFIIIAYFIFEMLNMNLKEFIKWDTLVILLTIIIMTIIFGIVVNKKILNNNELNDSLKIPMQNWIMIGLNGTGVYNDEDYAYIYQYPTYEEKKEASLEKIRERLGGFDSNTFIKHLNQKLKYTWTDGTYFAPEKLRREPINYNTLHEIVLPSGKYCKYYKYLPQVMHFSMLILIFIVSLDLIKNKKFNDKNIIFIITTFGFMLFFLIWENRSRYILTNVPIMMIIELNGIEILSNKRLGVKNK